VCSTGAETLVSGIRGSLNKSARQPTDKRAPPACKARTLSAPDILAFNSFDHPHAVEPKDEVASLVQSLVWPIPRASVTCLEMNLV
jgi:hypothetical protein